jgi:membrane associated rhomboid family serine protease
VFPYATDAPVYHFPFATIGLIVANVMTLGALIAGATDDIEPLLLVYGDGLHPLQWLTSNFIHAGFMHLAGNMVYLWGFGLVVEGKLGWWKFLLVYLGIGVVQCAVEQTIMLGADVGGSLGASAIIYGLLAIALVWAPENELSVFAFRFTFDISIKLFALIYIGLEAVTVFVEGFAVTSAALHLMGSVLGFVVGAAMLKLDWVDCEGWDLFSRLRGRSARRGERTVASAARPATAARIEPIWTPPKVAAAIDRMRTQVKAGQARAALAIYEQIALHAADSQWTESDLTNLIKTLLDAKLWNESVPVMVHFLRLFPQNDARVRLRLAQVLARELKRPGQALRVLAKIPAGSLPNQLDQVRVKLTQQATTMRDEGGLELETQDW